MALINSVAENENAQQGQKKTTGFVTRRRAVSSYDFRNAVANAENSAGSTYDFSGLYSGSDGSGTDSGYGSSSYSGSQSAYRRSAGTSLSASTGNAALDTIFEKAASTYGVSADILRAVAQEESGLNAGALNRSGAMGLMQLMPGTAKAMGATDPMDPEQNVMAGAKLLGTLLRKYDGNLELALAAYSAGEGAVDKYGGVPPYTETRNAIAKVMNILNNSSWSLSTSQTNGILADATLKNNYGTSAAEALTAASVVDGTDYLNDLTQDLPGSSLGSTYNTSAYNTAGAAGTDASKASADLLNSLYGGGFTAGTGNTGSTQTSNIQDILNGAGSNGAAGVTGTGAAAGTSSINTHSTEAVSKAQQYLEDIFRNAARDFDVNEDILKAVAKVASGYNTNAVSSNSNAGIMQLSRQNALDYEVTDRFNPTMNIVGAARKLRDLLDANGDNLRIALAAYDAGQDTVDEYGGVPPFRDTRNFISDVISAIQKKDLGFPSGLSLRQTRSEDNRVSETADETDESEDADVQENVTTEETGNSTGNVSGTTGTDSDTSQSEGTQTGSAASSAESGNTSTVSETGNASVSNGSSDSTENGTAGTVSGAGASQESAGTADAGDNSGSSAAGAASGTTQAAETGSTSVNSDERGTMEASDAGSTVTDADAAAESGQEETSADDTVTMNTSDASALLSMMMQSGAAGTGLNSLGTVSSDGSKVTLTKNTLNDMVDLMRVQMMMNAGSSLYKTDEDDDSGFGI